MSLTKRLDPARACWLWMQDPTITPAELLRTELDFRAKYRDSFVGRVGRIYYFQFRNGLARSLFLQSVQISYSVEGVVAHLVEAS